MADQYFLTQDGTVKGPFTLKELQGLLAEKKLKANFLVGTRATGPWERIAVVYKRIQAGQPLGLPSQKVPAAVKPSASKQPPSEPKVTLCKDCGKLMSKRATSCPHCRASVGVGDEGSWQFDLPDDYYKAPPIRRKTKKKKKEFEDTNRQQETTHGGVLYLISNFISEHRLIIYSMMALPLVVLAVTGVVKSLDVGMRVKSGLSGRDQIKYMNKTTAKWIELAKENQAHNAEVLWRDNRWMSLRNVLGVDWAALPDWFDALQHPNANRLAEDILQKWQSAEGNPYPEDLIAGIKSPNQRAQYWSIVVARKLKNQSDKDALIPALEQFRDGSDKVLSDAAVETLLAIRPTSEVSTTKPAGPVKTAASRAKFENAIRAAMTFVPGNKVLLVDELKLLKPTIQAGAESDVFALLEVVRENQTELNYFEMQKQSTIVWRKSKVEVRKALEDLRSLSPRDLEVPKIKATKQQGDALYAAYVAAEDITQNEGLILRFDPQLGDAERLNKILGPMSVAIASKYKIETKERSGVTYIPGTQLRQLIASSNNVLIDNINGMLRE